MDSRDWSLGVCEPHQGITLLSEKLLIWVWISSAYTCKVDQRSARLPGLLQTPVPWVLELGGGLMMVKGKPSAHR